MHKHAIIDLGTNTFHLLIIGISQKTFQELYRERIQVYLAEEGIERIGEKAFKRAMYAIEHFNNIVREFEVQNIHTIATAGFRKASNSQQLKDRIKERTGIPVQVISGKREAELIFKGVSMAADLQKDEDYLIMDIGGGSVEFIVVHEHKAVWSHSFEIGVAVLFHSFNQQDPIPESSILDMESFLDHKLQPLLKELRKFKISALLGASGSFEVLEGMVEDKEIHELYSILNASHFFSLCAKVIGMSYQERLQLENLPENRANLVVSGFLLMRYILKNSGATEIIVSKYALKEGLISELI